MTKNTVLYKLTRRTFLKATAVTAALVALGDELFGGPMSTLVESVSAAPVTEDVWIPTACKMCGTGAGRGCGILAHRVNGVVVGLKPDPRCKTARGRLCCRSHALIHKLYNPYRVRTPMKRTNPEKAKYNAETDRWEGVDAGWVEISWDEALNTVAAKLRAVREKNPDSLLHLRGHGSSSSSFGRDFSRSFGTHNNTISGGGGMICAAARHQIAYIYNGTSGMGSGDQDYVMYQISMGRSDGRNKASVGDVENEFDKNMRGCKTVVVDPRCCEEASKAYEWIPIKPATDGALGRAWCNVLLNELGIYDEEFMKERSNAPYLIGPDGFYMRSKTDLYESRSRNKETFGKPLIWDPVDGVAKIFDDETIKDFALEGNYTVDDVQCQPAFQLMKEHYKQFTPEWAEKICDVPAATIRRIAKEYGEAARIGSTITIDGHVFPYRPVCINAGRGWPSSRHGFVDCEVYAHLNAIVGNQDVPGGMQGGTSRSVKPEGDGVVAPGGNMRYSFKWPPHYQVDADIYPTNYKAYWETWRRVLDPEKYHMTYLAEVLIINGGNPTQTMASLDEVVQGIAKIPFSACVAYHFDQQAELCDILFADAGWAEELGLIGRTNAKLRQPLLEKPQYNTRFPEDVYLDLADRVGFLPEFLERLGPTEGDYALDVDKKYTWEEILDRQLRTKYGGEYGLEWFKRNGVEPSAAPTPAKEEYPYYFYPNRKTRYPIYFEYIKWAGEKLKSDMDALGITHPHPGAYVDFLALPDWLPGPVLEAPAEYDMIASNWKSATHTMGFTQDNPYLMEVSALHDPYLTVIQINRATGEKKGFKDGDIIWVESYNSGKRQRGPVRLSECIHPDSVMFGMTADQWSRNMNPDAQEGMIFNQLISTDYKWIDPVSGGIEVHAAVKVYKAEEVG